MKEKENYDLASIIYKLTQTSVMDAKPSGWKFQEEHDVYIIHNILAKYKGGISGVAVENPALSHFNQVIGVDIITNEQIHSIYLLMWWIEKSVDIPSKHVYCVLNHRKTLKWLTLRSILHNRPFLTTHITSLKMLASCRTLLGILGN